MNATLAPFIATISDQVPGSHAAVSRPARIAQNGGVLGGACLAQLFAKQLPMLFVGPSILAIGAMVVFASILPDQHLKGHAAADDERCTDHHAVVTAGQARIYRSPGGRGS